MQSEIHFESAKLILQQMVGWSDYRTVWAPAIHPLAFGTLRNAVEYLLSVKDGSVIPGEVMKRADLPASEILPQDTFTGEQFREVLRELYAEDFKMEHKYLSTPQKLRDLAVRNKSLADMFSGRNDSFESLSELQDQFTSAGRLGDPTPFRPLEKYIHGWERKRVYTLAAFSNLGKSKVMYQVVSHALRNGKRCLFISLEVESAVVLANVASSYLNKPYMDVLREGNCHQVLPKDLIRIVDDKYEFTEIADEVRRYSPDYVFVDFVQNVRNGIGEKYEVSARNAVDFQCLAKEAGVTMFLVSQVPNDSRFKDGENVNLKGGGELFASSDCIFSMHREQDRLFLTIAKNKVGPAMRKFTLDCDFDRGQIKVGAEVTASFGEKF